MNNQVLLFIFKSIKFLICLFLIDTAVGSIHEHVFFQQKSGKFFRINYTMEVSTDEVFIFGSSHAAAHYVPDVLEKELGRSCYNAGVAGQQILFHSTLQEIVLKRTIPKMIILDIDTYGFYQERYQYDRLSDFYPFYHRHPDVISKVLELKSKFSRYFLKSKLVQYNSTLIHVIRYWLSPQNDRKGYRATFVQLSKPEQIGKEQRENEILPALRARPFDKNMIAAIDQFVSNAKKKKVRVVLALSPTLKYSKASGDGSLEIIQAVADRHNVILLNYINNPDFLGHYELFADTGHLNDSGARLFSRMVANKIRTELPDLRHN